MNTRQRFFSKVDLHGPIHPRLGTRCWLWTGAAAMGYGKFWVGKRLVGAHRWSYEHHTGPIPFGHQIDHRCHVKLCVNPSHLRPATRPQQHENRSGAQSNSRSGVRGVRWSKGAWEANVTQFGISHYVGRFPTIEAAEAAVIAKRNEMFSRNDIDRNAAVAS